MTEEQFKTAKVFKNERGLWLVDPILKSGDGKDVLYPIMYYDEKERLEEVIKEIHKKTNFRSILEVGFGLGISSTIFQTYDLISHTIIEPHPTILNDLKDWAKDKINVMIINDFIQNKLDELKDNHYDLIFDDRYECVTPNIEPIWESFKAKYIVRFWGEKLTWLK